MPVGEGGYPIDLGVAKNRGKIYTSAEESILHNPDDDVVPASAIDFDLIKKRGGNNLGEEDYDVVKCGQCKQIYLIECEVFTVLLDPADLSKRDNTPNEGFHCISCNWSFPFLEAWIGPKGPASMRVTWKELAESPWRWIAPQLNKT